MNKISFSEFRRLTNFEVKSIVPVIVIVNGEDTYLVDLKENVICTGDLHLRVRNNLHAQEKKARAGMPPPETIQLTDSGKGKLLKPEDTKIEDLVFTV